LRFQARSRDGFGARRGCFAESICTWFILISASHGFCASFISFSLPQWLPAGVALMLEAIMVVAFRDILISLV
jgi:hypothetical protein